jgi:hypothetical protein
MRIKVERIAASLTERIKTWPGVEAIVLGETSENDILDPYFALGIDVYFSGTLPSEDERRIGFEDPGAFESSAIHMKDRFFIEGLPIHIDYKHTASIERLIQDDNEGIHALAQNGTYSLYRLERGNAAFSRSTWLDGMRQRALSFSETTWLALRDSFQGKMEHFLSDLGAAALKDDAYFYTLSIAGFLKSAGQTLFAIYKSFEPSSRLFTEHLSALSSLPEGFQGAWESLLKPETSMNRRKTFDIAKHLAIAIVKM